MHSWTEQIQLYYFEQLDVTDTSPILVWGQPAPHQNPSWKIVAEGGGGLHENSTFPKASFGTV